MRRNALGRLQPLFGLLAVALSGLAVHGCGSSSGRQVSPTAFSNLTVENQGLKTLHVYVDGGQVGEVRPGQTGYFNILTGVRPVHLRPRGEERRYYGDLSFGGAHVIDIVFWPGQATNLVVENHSPRTLHVYVDLNEVGEVPPGYARDFWVDPGTRDIHFRERGDPGLDYVGTFSFPQPGDGPEIQLIYTN